MNLTVTKIKDLPNGSKTHDGNGLYLTISPKGRGKWSLRYMIGGLQREMGLGPYPLVTLANAREMALKAKLTILNGDDPLKIKQEATARKAASQKIKFSDTAEAYISRNKPRWSSPKHMDDWSASLRRHAYGTLDQKPLHELVTDDIIEVLTPLWFTRHETARRLQGRIKMIIGSAIAEGRHPGPNPARWDDHLCHYFPALRLETNHHRAIDWHDVPDFWDALIGIDTTASQALQFTALTAARTSEVRGARPEEFDLERMLWYVPAKRMKLREDHVVPLSEEAAMLIDRRLCAHNHPLVFASRDPERPLSNMAMLSLLKKRLPSFDTTVHGLRSTFRDWAAETGDYNQTIVEFALAHKPRSRVEAAYLRTRLVEKRRPLMQDWSDHLHGR